MGLKLITPPSVEPLTLAEARLHCSVDDDMTDFDDAFRSWIITAREQAELRTNRVFITQTWQLTRDCFPFDSLELPKPSLQAVNSVKYLDSYGALQTLDPALYQVVTDEPIGRILPAYGQAWPTARHQPGSVRVEFDSGYGDAASDVPESIKSWMKLAIAAWWENRAALFSGSAVAELPYGFAEGLLDKAVIRRFI